MSTTDAERGQLNTDAARIYEEFFVPALFAEWAPRLDEAVQPLPRPTLLDVGCGTGVVARAVAAAHPEVAVVGLDPNESMLAVAEQRASDVDWTRGVAESLPYSDGRFGAVVSQFALMFFDDRVAALREMRRVTDPDGKVAVAVWSSLERNPGYAEVTQMLFDLFGEEAANAMHAPFCLGEPAQIEALLGEAGIGDFDLFEVVGKARFETLDDWMFTDIRGWTLAEMIDDVQFEQLKTHASERLARFVGDDGRVEFDSPALIAVF